MKLRNALTIIIPLLIIGSLFIIKLQKYKEEAYLIPSENLVFTNIESIEIFNRPKNEMVLIDDKLKIEQIASLLVDFNLKNIDSVDNNTLGDSIYDIYITNTGRYPDTPINAKINMYKVAGINMYKSTDLSHT